MVDNQILSSKKMSIKRQSSINDETISLELDRVWRSIFEKYDLDRDDKISLDEFRLFIKERNQELKRDIPSEVLNEILERADWDKNRYITYNEFLCMINSRENCNHHPKINFLIRNVAKFTIPKRERQTVIRKYFEEYKPSYFFPYFVIILSLIEISTFTYRWIFYGPFASSQMTNNILIYDPHKRKQIWRFLTYIFVHRDIFHLLYNIIGQLTTGLLLELVHGSSRVMFIFLISAIYGSLYSAMTDPQVYTAGASGGVYALFAAHSANLIINFQEIDFAIYQLVFLTIVYVLDLGQAIYHRYNRTIEDRPIAYVVHITGFFCGLLIGLIVLRNLKVHKWEQILQYVALALFVFGLVTSIVYNIMMTPPFDDRKW